MARGHLAADPADLRWMSAAIALARRGRGRVAPNPAVAALIVRDGRLLARGLTAPGGRPHAEAEALLALAKAGENAVGATVYVTLEPCAHHGRTPPCADALLAAGVVRVVCPMIDPDPRVAGRGIARLRAAGIEVTVGLLGDEAAAVNDGFLSVITRSRPALSLKLATTLDGRIATRTGESRWITGPAARLRVHAMRAEADAILIGAGTARADDPMLDVRGLGPDAPQPLRVVADPRLTLPPDGKLATTAHRHPAAVLCRGGAGHGEAVEARASILKGLGVRLLEVAPGADDTQPSAAVDDGGDVLGTTAGIVRDHGAVIAAQAGSPGHITDHGQGMLLSPEAMLGRLASEGVNSVFCEGGGRLAGALMADGLVDRLITVTAGVGIGSDGVPSLGPMGISRLAGVPRFRLVDLERLGEDVIAEWSPACGGG
ncbi:MAG: bifunctional diaminohydroxyphosphoribosylaminopyrimidine deaminase/5-amino-6-(5-phosphoribosylamino)uracil reductase RibD [Pseudomonadota bacterium]